MTKTFTVLEVNRKENSKGDRNATIVLKHVSNVRGPSVIKLQIDDDEANEFSLGEFFELELKQVSPPE